MTTGPESALVTGYLDDLARMLDGADPDVRAEVLGGVREHVDAALGSLGRPATEPDVWRVLGELGPPEAVAQEAMSQTDPGSTTRSASRADTTSRDVPPPPLTRPWVAVVVLALLTVATALIFILFFGGSGDMILASLWMPLALYVPALALLLVSPLWRGWWTVVGAWAPWILPVGLYFVGRPLMDDSGPTATWQALLLVLAVLAAASLIVTAWVGTRESRALQLSRRAA